MNWTEDEYKEYIERRKNEALTKLENLTASEKPKCLPPCSNSLKTAEPVKTVLMVGTNEKEIVADFIVPLPPITKKNHGQLASVGKRCPVCGKGEKTIMLPSKPYREYETAIRKYLMELHRIVGTIDYPVNLKCLFYVKARRQSDLVGYLQSIQDLMTKYKVIQDDCRDIIAATDGSMVLYDKDNPRTEITITRLADYEQWGNASKEKQIKKKKVK